MCIQGQQTKQPLVSLYRTACYHEHKTLKTWGKCISYTLDKSYHLPYSQIYI